MRLNRIISRRVFIALAATLGLMTLRAPAAPPYADKLGLELDGLGDGSRSKPFVDLAKTLRPWTPAAGQGAIATDPDGWPLADCQTVLFDIRPFGTWAPPIDDPDAFQPDWSGTYKLSFHGSAVLATNDPAAVKITRQTYDPAANTTTADLTVARGEGLCTLRFSQTRRAPSAPPGGGLTALRVIRPGYDAGTTQTFTNEFLRALRPFRVLRFMDWLDTNHNPGFFGDQGHHALEWAGRRLPGDAVQVNAGGKYGVAWEYIVQLANQTGKDIWINVPVAATDDYVRQLALLLKKTLDPKIVIYVEHSNEVWNFGFPQYIYNKLAAVEEVGRGGSPLNNDGSKDQEVWTHRRHAERLHDIALIFSKVFGEGSLNTRVRPVYASWVINPGSHYRDVLAWAEKTWGPPKNYFYALAGAAYFNAQKAAPAASPEEVLAAMRRDSDNNLKYRTALQALAGQYGLKHMQYEVGPDTGGGNAVNVANRIRANRLPAMKDLILHDAVENWFSRGGDLYMYFAAPGGYSRHGCWGLSEDINDLATPKWQAIEELTKVK